MKLTPDEIAEALEVAEPEPYDDAEDYADCEDWRDTDVCGDNWNGDCPCTCHL